MALEITTNYQPRAFLLGCELSPEEREQFDYIAGWNPEAYDYDEDSDEFSTHSFVRYKGHLYDVGEFMYCPTDVFGGYWHGYSSDSFFSGVLIRLSDDGEECVMGTYISKMDD